MCPDFGPPGAGKRLLLECLLAGGPSRFSLLRSSAGVSSKTLTRYLSQLQEDHIIVLGGDRLYRLADPPALRLQLATYRSRFPDLLADATDEVFEATRWGPAA